MSRWSIRRKLLVCLAIVLASTRLSRAAIALGLGLILGGALGNLTDRIIHGPGVSGRVVDFIDFRIWPVFNVADSCIVIGALLLVLSSTRRDSKGGRAPEAMGETTGQAEHEAAGGSNRR